MMQIEFSDSEQKTSFARHFLPKNFENIWTCSLTLFQTEVKAFHFFTKTFCSYCGLDLKDKISFSKSCPNCLCVCYCYLDHLQKDKQHTIKCSKFHQLEQMYKRLHYIDANRAISLFEIVQPEEIVDWDFLEQDLIWKSILSEWLTFPMTIYAILRSDWKPVQCLEIHVIGSSSASKEFQLVEFQYGHLLFGMLQKNGIHRLVLRFVC